MDKKLKKIELLIIVVFAVRSVLYFIGKSDFSLSAKELFLGNGTIADIGNQLFCVACFLAVLEMAVAFVYRVKDEIFKNIGNSSRIRKVRQDLGNGESMPEMSTPYLDYLINFEIINRRQGNYFFLAAIIAFAAGVVLIGGGTVFAYSKMGNMAMTFLVLSGIISEIVSICFGFMYNKLMKQTTFVHNLINKKEKFNLLMEEAKKLDNKEEMMMKIFKKALND